MISFLSEFASLINILTYLYKNGKTRFLNNASLKVVVALDLDKKDFFFIVTDELVYQDS